MPHEKTHPSFFKIIFNDMKRLFRDLFSGHWFRMMSRDLRDLHDFYIDKERKIKLESMNWFKKWFLITFWLVKELILRLSSFRRALFILALIFIFASSSQGNSDNKILFGVLLFMFVLLLELKDKLLARQELEAGRTVQKALLPDECPSVPGWDVWLYSNPANDVGGDLVDFVVIDNNRFGLVLGDVAGKGLGAALFMAKLQSTLRALVFNIKSLSKLAESMNNIFYRDTIPNSFASMFYLEIMQNSGAIKYVNAGHLPPIVLKRRQDTMLSKGAQALGIMPDVSYTEQNLELATGDYLLIYSDGLSEARNSDGLFYGDERIQAILPQWNSLSAKNAGRLLLDDVNDFAGDTAQTDDLSLIILKKTD